KVVLWFFFEGNDFEDLTEESKTPLLKKYLTDTFKQGLFERQADIDQALMQYIERYVEKKQVSNKDEEWDSSSLSLALIDSVKLSRLRSALGLVYGRAVEPQGPYDQARLDLFRDVLLRAKSSVEAWGGTVYFVYLPDRDRYANGEDYHRQSVLAVVREIGLPIIDLHARFKRESDPLRLFPFGRFGHYNEEGNRLVGEEVLRSISPALNRHASHVGNSPRDASG
ncbi:MAG TPA: hypothetical protein VH985_06395, partial [Candidatus Binatia bacterium]